MQIPDQPTYVVVTCVSTYRSFAEASAMAPEVIAEHVQRSKELHQAGTLLLAGAILREDDGPLTTMAVAISPEAARVYLEGDPFFLTGQIAEWSIQKWANMFAQ